MMKRMFLKCFILVLTVALMLPMMGVVGSAETTSYGRGKSAVVYQGLPTVDGVVDEAWNYVAKHEITMDNNGHTQAQRITDAWFSVMYDPASKVLTFLVHAKDSFVLPETINAEVNKAASWANDLVGIGVAVARPNSGVTTSAQCAEGFEMIDLYNNRRRGYSWVTSAISKTATSNGDEFGSSQVEYYMEVAVDLSVLAEKQGQQLSNEIYFDVYLVDTGYYNGSQFGWTPGSASGNGGYARAQTYTWNANSWDVSSGLYNYYGTASIATQGVLTVGAQTTTASNEGDFTKVRFSAKILGDQYTDAGFRISVSDTDHVMKTDVQDLKCTVAYKSILADGKTVRAGDGYYFIVITVDNVPTGIDGLELIFTPYAVGSNGTTFEGTKCKFNLANKTVEIAK